MVVVKPNMKTTLRGSTTGVQRILFPELGNDPCLGILYTTHKKIGSPTLPFNSRVRGLPQDEPRQGIVQE